MCYTQISSFSLFTKAGQKAKTEGNQEATQPTNIAHDKTKKVGELICCPLWNCVKAQLFMSKDATIRLLSVQAHSALN